MTDNNRTHLLMISDRSGSMHEHRDDTEGGINAFLDTHRTGPGRCDITFVQFDDQYETVYSGRLYDMPRYELRPRNSTALLDAIGRAVTELGERLSAMAEYERPADVLCVISTDGRENASREWTQPRIKALLEQQQSQWHWQVIFLGANIDAVSVGRAYGVQPQHSMTYDQHNVRDTYAVTATNTSNYRVARASGQSVAAASGALDFTDEQRQEALRKQHEGSDDTS